MAPRTRNRNPTLGVASNDISCRTQIKITHYENGNYERVIARTM